MGLESKLQISSQTPEQGCGIYLGLSYPGGLVPREEDLHSDRLPVPDAAPDLTVPGNNLVGKRIWLRHFPTHLQVFAFAIICTHLPLPMHSLRAICLARVLWTRKGRPEPLPEVIEWSKISLNVESPAACIFVCVFCIYVFRFVFTWAFLLVFLYL